ncbi:MAG: hypothetical protein R6U50_01955 [Desulfobacterales bacterium]
MHGQACFESVSALETGVDLAVIVTPRYQPIRIPVPNRHFVLRFAWTLFFPHNMSESVSSHADA